MSRIKPRAPTHARYMVYIIYIISSHLSPFFLNTSTESHVIKADYLLHVIWKRQANLIKQKESLPQAMVSVVRGHD